MFACPACGTRLFIHNRDCICGAALAFDPDLGFFIQAASTCANRAEIGCNWIAETPDGLCRACTMTAVIPDNFHQENTALWAEAEAAKRWVLTTLARWGWFRADDLGLKPAFHLLSERTRSGDVPVTMGHAEGVVTIDVAESDPTERVRRREALAEPYRTMIGHFRHELAHFLFRRLADDDGFVASFRELFGDERVDYADALERYYAGGPPADWRARHITAYASAHPHEDWAETTAHLLHLTDIVDSAVAMGLAVAGTPTGAYDAYAERDADRLITLAVDQGLAINHVNRAMGNNDLYPFVLTPVARQKLAFVHRWLRDGGRAPGASA